MDLYNIVCPYCQCAVPPRDYEEGYQAVVCMECNKPFVNQTTMTPVFHSFALVGIEPARVVPTPEEIKEDAKYFAKHPEELDEPECLGLCSDCVVSEYCHELIAENVSFGEQTSTLCEQNSQNMNKCLKCGHGFEDHGITDGVCPSCFLDEDSVKGLSDEGNNAAAEIADKGKPCQKDPNGFQILENNTHVSYMIQGELVNLRYNGQANIVTTLADIYELVEELKESGNVTSSIEQLLGEGVKTRNVKVSSIDAFVKAVSMGLLTQTPAPEEDDSDYKPMLSNVINTRCNYDGGKIGEM